ncbi:MAG: Smr/MutS family protein [Clostridia bacterium]|nr:Smr/MutS family protein [Clostridia bacterium]
MLKEINVENGFSSQEALDYVKQVLLYSKKDCIYIIHGYGSSGKGGIIRQKLRSYLNAQLKNGKVKSVINGEDFNVFNLKALELKNKYKELEQLFRVCNHGVTIVEV